MTEEVIAWHVSIPTCRVSETVEFYRSILGFDVNDASTTEVVQLTCGQNRLSVVSVSDDSSSLQRDGSRGLRARHFGFRLSRPDVLKRMKAEILRVYGTGALVEDSQRGDDEHSLILVDPGGNQVELYYSKRTY